MERLARNLDDLRKLVHDLVRRGVHVRFVKESLTFTGEDSPMAHLLLTVIGVVAQFKLDLIGEREREGITLAKQRKVYLGRVRSLLATEADDLRRMIKAGEWKALLAREFGISCTTVYEYLGREVSDGDSLQHFRRTRAGRRSGRRGESCDGASGEIDLAEIFTVRTEQKPFSPFMADWSTWWSWRN